MVRSLVVLLGIGIVGWLLVVSPRLESAGPASATLNQFSSNLTTCSPPIEPVPLQNPTILTTCTAESLQAALAAGGHIAFNCGPNPVTISVDTPLVTSATEDIVLDGGGRITLDGQNTTRILEKPFTPGSENDKTLGNDLTIQNMRFLNALAPAATRNRDGNARGGAVTAVSPGTRLHIINSTFRNNTTTSINDEDNQGGAVYVANIFETVIVGSVFEQNTAGSGGAFGGIATGLIVYNSRFVGNAAADTSTGGVVKGHGGAIHLDGVTNSFNPDSNKIVDVCGSEFVNNTAVRGGGAFKVTVSDNQGTKATYQDSTFTNNRLVGVPPSEGHGGAIYHIEDDALGADGEDNLEIRNATFNENVAYRQGGAVWLLIHGNGRIVNTTFVDNRASEAGSNRIGQGGAVMINNGFIDIVNTTFANNFATFQGGALFAGETNEGRVVTLRNSLFADNRLDPTHNNPASSEFQGYHTNRPQTNGGGNLQFPRTKEPDFDNDINNFITEPTSTILFADPLLEPLADNGGATLTRALPANSPAINAGVATGCPATDQRGITRPQGAGCDIGAFEFTTQQQSTATPTPSSTPTVGTPTPTATAGGPTSTPTVTPLPPGELSTIYLPYLQR